MDLAPSIAALFCRFGRWSSRSRKPAELTAAELGPLGEHAAERHLRRHGHRVLYRNFRAPHGGEVDLVCRDKRARTLVFVEVKTRRTLAFGHPNEAVNASKQHLIAKGALAWLRLLDNPDVLFRFDIAEVVFEGAEPRVNVIQNAFTLPSPYLY
jgi:putative endonuclease